MFIRYLDVDYLMAVTRDYYIRDLCWLVSATCSKMLHDMIPVTIVTVELVLRLLIAWHIPGTKASATTMLTHRSHVYERQSSIVSDVCGQEE